SNVKSPPVESALSDFLGHFTTETDAMFTRTLSCLQGVNEATLAYNEGQEEMAAEAQRQAGTTENLDMNPPPPTESPHRPSPPPPHPPSRPPGCMTTCPSSSTPRPAPTPRPTPR